MRDYVGIARQYCEDILSGKTPACKFVRLACERQVNDLHRATLGDADFPFYFDETAASRVCFFIEKFPHIEGPLAGTAIELSPWQVFVLTTVFGWLKHANGKRRYRRVYIEIPRGNGKSALSSPLAVYMLCADKEGGPQVYSAARTKEQARVVFDIAKKMLRSELGHKICKRFGIQVLQHSIVHPASNGIFRPLASEAESLDGLNVHFGCLDELHAHPTAEVHDVLDTATGKRDQSMLWMITTAGVDQTGICYATRDYVIKILEGTFTDESYWGIVYTVDAEDLKDDKWATPEVARKANPNFGISVFADDLEQKCKKALQQVTAQTNYKTKHLDIWQSVGAAWMDMLRFNKCADPTLKETDFLGKQCIPGLDLAAKLDLLSLVNCFWDHREDADGKTRRHYTAFWRHWMPEARVIESNTAIQGWVADGHIRVCPGETNDFNEVEDAIRESWTAFQCPEVAHDPFGALEMVNKLTAEQITMFQVDQNVKNLSPAMKELEAAIYDGRFHYDGDPVATWAMSNVIAKPDKKDNIFPFKLKKENKIDPISALLASVIRIMMIDTSLQETGGVTNIGPCTKCGELCIGTLQDSKIVYLCAKHVNHS